MHGQTFLDNLERRKGLQWIYLQVEFCQNPFTSTPTSNTSQCLVFWSMHQPDSSLRYSSHRGVTKLPELDQITWDSKKRKNLPQQFENGTVYPDGAGGILSWR